MSCFKLPSSVCRRVEGLIGRFFWGGKPKNLGGMGFRRIKAFNKAMLAKQMQRLINNGETLAAQVLKAKKFPNSSPLVAKKPFRASYTWQSILYSSELVEHGAVQRVGDGNLVKVWVDRWIRNTDSSNSSMGVDQNLLVANLINHKTLEWDIQRVQQLFQGSSSSKVARDLWMLGNTITFMIKTTFPVFSKTVLC